MGKLVDECTLTQKIAGGTSMCISIVYMVVAFYWGSQKNTTDVNNIKDGYLGGFNKCTVHAVLMILAMGCCYTQAVLSYRVLHFLSHRTTKIIHGLWHTLTVALVITALVFIIQFHNDVRWGHLSTMHSWLGLLLLFVYFQNWVVGLVSFGLGDLVPLRWKKTYMPSHRFLGIVGFLLAPVVMETGIAQKSWIDGTFGCMYSITNNGQIDNPGAHYSDIAPGCRVGFGIGIMVILNTLLAIFALWDFNAGVESPEARPADVAQHPSPMLHKL